MHEDDEGEVMFRWWDKLGLKMTVEGRPDERRISAREQVLATLVPVWPEEGWPEEGNGRLTLADVEQLVSEPVIDPDRDRAEEAARREYGWAKIRAEYEAPDADAVITEGVWEGFTRARARAWLWNFVQYPVTHPLFYGRLYPRLVATLEAGELIEDEADARTARKHEADGTTPHDYRRALELIGERTFSADDVTAAFPD